MGANNRQFSLVQFREVVAGSIEIMKSFDFSDVGEEQRCLDVDFRSDNSFVNITAFIKTPTKNLYVSLR